MKIKHKLSNNKLEITVTLTPRTHKDMPLIVYDSKAVVKYCKLNDLPVGELISQDVTCTNDDGKRSIGSWTFSIDKSYKKRLTSKKNLDTINNKANTKKSSARTRARNIARSSRKRKDESNQPTTE